MADFTWLDYLIFGVFFLNIILGLARGLLREIIGILSLIVALLVSIKFTLPITEFLNSSDGFKSVISAFTSFTDFNVMGPLSYISLGVSFLILFVGTYSIGEAVNYYAPAFGVLMFPRMAFIDRILAASLGYIRGYVFSLVLILVVGLSPITLDATWTQSRLIPPLKPSADRLGNLVRPGGLPNR